MEIKRITSGLFLTNNYLLIENNHAILIDCGLDLINKLNLNGLILDAILLTHGHIDHIASINSFDCPIYIYENEEEFLSNNNLNLSQAFNIEFKFNHKRVIKLKNNEIISLLGHSIKVFHTPGHTRGSVCYLIDDYLFTGDTLFQVGIGRTDFVTGSYPDIISSVNFILNNFKDDLIIYPGHGESTTIEFEKKYNPYYNKE